MSIKPAPPRRSNSRRQTGAPTISDVARLAQVSPMTVSRVINGEGNVRATTRTAVQAAITALNYSPNQSARSLARAGQLRLGLLCSNPSDAYLSAFLLGSLEQASRSNIQLIVQKCELDDHEQEVVARLIASGVDGIILPPPLCDAPLLLDMLRDAAMPAMVIATSDPQAGFGAVSIGDHAAACEMTQHLLALGHQRIGFITGNPNLTASGERLAGYRAALEGRGITFDAGLVAHGLFTYRSGLDAAEELLDRDDPPTAVFASNDDMAAAAVAMAHRRGLDVPGDLTVVGFDDSAIARMIWPELTTIHQPIAEMSRTGVELLAAMLRDRRNGGNAEPQHLVLDYTLIRRQSDAAPRQRPKARRWG